MVSGDSINYLGGTTHRPIPLATEQTCRPTHAHEPKPKTTGLDWDHLERTCTICRERKPGRLTPEGACTNCAPHVVPKELPDNVEVNDYANTYVTYDADQLETHLAPQTPQAADPAPLPPVPAPAVPPTAAAATPRPAATPDRPETRAKVHQLDPDHIAITLTGHGIAHRHAEIAGFVADLLDALAKTPAPADDVDADGLRDQRGGGARKGKPTPSPRAKRPKKADTWPEEVITDICTRYTAGASTTTLGRDYYTSATTITHVLRDHGITIRPPVAQPGRTLTDTDIDTLVADYTGGLSLLAAAEKSNIAKRRARAALLARGVTLRPAYGPRDPKVLAHKAETGAIRAWALANGYPVKGKGRFTRDVLNAYATAHPTESTTNTHQEHTS